MGVFSKPSSNRRNLILPAICTALLAFSQVGHAQYFADISYQSAGSQHDQMYQQQDQREDTRSAVEKLNSQSTVWDYISAHQQDFIQAGGFGHMRDQFNQVYGVLTGDRDAIRRNNAEHRQRGALRSGMGSPEQAHRRQKEFEERERIADLIESKAVPETHSDANKVYNMWLEKQRDRPGVRNDPKYELVAHETLYLHAEDIIENDKDMKVSRPARILKSSINGDEVTINRLEEPYPTECFNHGRLAKQMQKYYMCKSLKTASGGANAEQQAFRVDSDTYHLLLTNYSDQYSCYTQNVENNVCVCSGGSIDYECYTNAYTRCYLNITNPAFYEGCEDKFEDSFYYLYSIPGFSPCFWKNFSESIDVEFDLVCQQIDSNGLVASSEPRVGYPYRDVIREADKNVLKHVSQSPETEFMAAANEETISTEVKLEFRDMKYLSKSIAHTTTINAVKDGTTQGVIPGVDFSELKQSDKSGASKYIVGGRVYFEGSAKGSELSSFTFRGFFDEDGYEEPKSTLSDLKSSGWLYVIIGGAIALVVGAIVLYCYCKSKKEQERVQKKTKAE